MKTKLAKFMLYGKGSYLKEAESYILEDPDYTRTTEIVEVDFVELPQEVIVPAQIDALNKQIKQIREDAADKVVLIEEKISKLLAIEDHSNDN